MAEELSASSAPPYEHENLFRLSRIKERTMQNSEISELDDDIEFKLDSSLVSEQVLLEVSEWKLEARNEDNNRYFYHVNEVASIEDGKRAYVIGRKGSGKTAISEYIGGIQDHDTFSEKLTFKNFPFNDLYNLNNNSFAKPNQYITLWKYLIYSTICQMMLRNQAISRSARDSIEKVFGTSELTLDRRIGKWTASDFEISALSISLKVSGSGSATNETPNWITRVDILEDFIHQNIDDSRYFVIFDELDEDYSLIAESAKFESYTALLTSLFKAVQDVKARFKQPIFRVNPIVFLRDDIYSLMDDSDKNKWSDFKIDLFWDEQKARDVVAFRLTRALDPSAASPLPFEEIWPKFIGAPTMPYGTRQRNRMDTFSYMARSTYLRPRDFVKYLQECAARAIATHQRRITSDIIKSVDTAFSSYLKDELRDEIFAILPAIRQIFDAMTEVGKWNFSYSDFELAYRSVVDPDASRSNINFCLQVLFIFSVIGTALNHSYFVFKYTHKDAQMNYKNKIVVHRGLFKALQIV